MTRDEIIRMAREAGLLLIGTADGSEAVYTWPQGITDEIERFAALVAAAEREAIVQMIDNAPALVEYVKNDQGGCLMCGFTPKLAAASIKARGKE